MAAQARLEGTGQIKNLKAVSNGMPAKDPIGFTYNTTYTLASHDGTLTANISARKNNGASFPAAYQMREAHGRAHEPEWPGHVD